MNKTRITEAGRPASRLALFVVCYLTLVLSISWLIITILALSLSVILRGGLPQ